MDGMTAGARTISEAMRGASVPDTLRAELASLRELAERRGGRATGGSGSSALGEDSQEATFAAAGDYCGCAESRTCATRCAIAGSASTADRVSYRPGGQAHEAAME